MPPLRPQLAEDIAGSRQESYHPITGNQAAILQSIGRPQLQEDVYNAMDWVEDEEEK